MAVQSCPLLPRRVSGLAVKSNGPRLQQSTSLRNVPQLVSWSVVPNR
jgi:hypothetical protein